MVAEMRGVGSKLPMDENAQAICAAMNALPSLLKVARAAELVLTQHTWDGFTNSVSGIKLDAALAELK